MLSQLCVKQYKLQYPFSAKYKDNHCAKKQNKFLYFCDILYPIKSISALTKQQQRKNIEIKKNCDQNKTISSLITPVKLFTHPFEKIWFFAIQNKIFLDRILQKIFILSGYTINLYLEIYLHLCYNIKQKRRIWLTG